MHGSLCAFLCFRALYVLIIACPLAPVNSNFTKAQNSISNFSLCIYDNKSYLSILSELFFPLYSLFDFCHKLRGAHLVTHTNSVLVCFFVSALLRSVYCIFFRVLSVFRSVRLFLSFCAFALICVMCDTFLYIAHICAIISTEPFPH